MPLRSSRGSREFEAPIGAEPAVALAELREQNPQLYETLVEGTLNVGVP
jgi:hypothetical protein